MKKVLTLVIATACTIVAYGGNTSEVGGSSAAHNDYDAQARIDASRNYWAGRQKFTCGLNYMPIPEVVIKGEFGYGLLKQNPNSSSLYNNEPYVALGINYCGFFRL